MAPNIAYNLFYVGGIWLHRAVKYDRHYLQHTKRLQAAINISRFHYVYLITVLSLITKVHTFLRKIADLCWR
jgi:hypothetical protein